MWFFFYFDEETNETKEMTVEQPLIDLGSGEFEFLNDNIRYLWHKQEEEWYFSIVDVVQVLTGSSDGRKYWNKLKQRLKEEGSELVTNCHQLRLKAADGKRKNRTS
ncbi:hypothetical protein [Senimuribacter intestinalis]|uniref:hypothetical protein n=1 Tax=Senimuribacter intestinalis TaxID=2941507 RepID=UPI00203B916C|nr:hypothetical protein [Senimuribacter intestinalis]